MKGRLLLLDRIDGRDAAALVVDGRLEEFALDPADDAILPGAILRAVADRPVKGLGGMFVRLPGGARGFLRQTDGVAPGRPLIVQAGGPAEPGKALPVTTRILFKSRHAIVTPGAPGLNLSRQLRDGARRAELTALAEAAMAGAPADHGLILRTSCAQASGSDILADIAAMRELAAAVMADVAGEPELLVAGPGAEDLAWRDWTDPVPDAMEVGAFAAHGVPELVDALLDPRVPLPGGAHMWIEPTHALVAVDVNTGADTTPAAALKASIAAARDLPRQLRLRGLGGQVMVDFAPVPRKDRQVLDQVLRAAFRADGSEATLVGWTALGLYEITRRRDRLPLAQLLPRGMP